MAQWGSDLELGGREIKGGVFEQLSEFPSNPVKGQLIELIQDGNAWVYYYNGVKWVTGVSSLNGQQGDLLIDKSSLGLGNVDNTSDIDKPVSTAQALAISDLSDTIDSRINLRKLNYIHTQSTSQTVWTITHNLGFDPAGIVIISDDGYILDGFGIQYLSEGQSLRISFDLSFSGTAVLS